MMINFSLYDGVTSTGTLVQTFPNPDLHYFEKELDVTFFEQKPFAVWEDTATNVDFPPWPIQFWGMRFDKHKVKWIGLYAYPVVNPDDCVVVEKI
jgi:hypothetical protein